MAGKRKQRPGYYGRIYGDWADHAKVRGGFHDGEDLPPLSFHARGLWVSLVSVVVRKESDGRFSTGDILSLGASEEWLSELEANGLVDRDGSCWRLHDYADHAITKREWASKQAGAKARKERFRNANGNGGGTHEEREENAEGTRSDTRSSLTLPLRSKEREDGAVQARQVTDAGPSVGSVSNSVMVSSIAAYRERGLPAPRQCTQMWAGWVDIARWLIEAAEVQGWPAGWQAEKPRWLVAKFFDDPRATAKGWPIGWLASNPAEYALAESEAA